MESVEAKGPNRRRAQEGLAVIVDSIYFKGHTCFRKKWSGFDAIKPINVIIGRNNAGKSHLLELVEALCSGPCQNRSQTLSTSRGAVHRRETSRSGPDVLPVMLRQASVVTERAATALRGISVIVNLTTHCPEWNHAGGRGLMGRWLIGARGPVGHADVGEFGRFWMWPAIGVLFRLAGPDFDPSAEGPDPPQTLVKRSTRRPRPLSSKTACCRVSSPVMVRALVRRGA